MSAGNISASVDPVPKEYQKWLKDLKKEMIDKGISEKTIKKAFDKDYFSPKPEVVILDRNQPEFLLTTTEYLNRLITNKRVIQAQKQYKLLQKNYPKIEAKYGVPLEFLVAFWALETNFGERMGGFELIGSLIKLSYDKRRSSFFRKELYEALKIMDKYDFELEEMKGSWAGAIGHFQFMPSTFNSYAVDYDGDGKIDVWNNFGDSLASAANYLSKLSWRKNEAWGTEITLSYKFNYSLIGFDKTKTIGEWNRLGVLDISGMPLSYNKASKAAIIMPEGRKGKIYLVFDNFRKIMIWNRSESYAIAIGTASDYIKSGKKWKEEKNELVLPLRTKDILILQKFINKHKIAKIDEDGVWGKGTKQAIMKLQKKVYMPEDAYPDYRLINRIKKFDDKQGFTIPVQPSRKKQ